MGKEKTRKCFSIISPRVIDHVLCKRIWSCDVAHESWSGFGQVNLSSSNCARTSPEPCIYFFQWKAVLTIHVRGGLLIRVHLSLRINVHSCSDLWYTKSLPLRLLCFVSISGFNYMHPGVYLTRHMVCWVLVCHYLVIFWLCSADQALWTRQRELQAAPKRLFLAGFLSGQLFLCLG